MDMIIRGKKIVSARTLTVEETKGVFERYQKSEAVHKDKDGNLFLTQQRWESPIIQSALTPAEIRAFCEERKIKWNDAYNGRVKTYVASDESTDSYGDIIRQNGWDLKERFRKNPVAMWGHDYYQPPVGNSIKETIVKGDNPQLLLDILFMTQEQYPFADTIFKMVDAGFLRGNSVGFIPVRVVDVQEQDERDSLGLGKYGVIFEKQVLLEDSIVSIGANKNALVQNQFASAATKGIISVEEIKSLLKDQNKETAVNDSLKEMFEQALSIVTEKTISVPPVKKDEPEVPAEKPEPEKQEPQKQVEPEWARQLAETLGGMNAKIAELKEALTIEIKNGFETLEAMLSSDGGQPQGKDPSPDTKLYDELFKVAKTVDNALTKKGE